MYTTTNKRRITIYVICAFLFALAGFFQAVDSSLPEFWHALFALMVHTILICLVVLWGVSLIHRMVRRDLLAFFLTISILILLFLVVRMIKYGLTEEIDTLSRYLWYSYYVPQCLIPPTLFLAVMSIENKKGKPLKKIWYLIYIPAIIIIILIYTNDIHELAFKLNFNNGDFSYNHKIIFYLALSWEVVMTFVSIIGMFLKCSVSACKKRIWIPICTFIVCATLSTICFLVNTKSFKIPELLCFTCIAVIESCISIGLIPSNYEYESFFYKSVYSAIITNENLDIVYSSQSLPQIDKETLRNATRHSVMINENTRLSSERIYGGYAFRFEDLSQINEINAALNETNERITDENYLIKAENEMKEQKAQIAEQNRIYAITEEYTYEEINELEKILLEMENKQLSDDEFRKQISLSCIMAAYIKRRSNLVMLTEKNVFIDAGELFLSLKESLDYLLLSGTECSIDYNIKGNISGLLAGIFYDFFETCIKAENYKLNAIFIHVYKKDENMIMLIESDTLQDIVKVSKRIKEKFVNFASNIVVKTDDDATYYSLSLPLGGRL